jgi:PEP-CTERM motif-containing protein
MRKLFILTAIVGLIGAVGYAPEASASSVFFEQTSAPCNPCTQVTFNVVMTIDGTGGGDGQVSNTSVLINVSNPAVAVITAGVSAPTASGVGVTNFQIRPSTFTPTLGTCVTTATTSSCTASVGQGATDAGYYGGLSSGVASFGTFTVGTVTVTVIGPGEGTTTLQPYNRPGIDEWTDGAGNILPTQPTLLGADLTVIPEPATASLIGVGLVGLILVSRRRSH